MWLQCHNHLMLIAPPPTFATLQVQSPNVKEALFSRLREVIDMKLPWWKTLLLRRMFIRYTAVSLSGAFPVFKSHLTASFPTKQHWNVRKWCLLSLIKCGFSVCICILKDNKWRERLGRSLDKIPGYSRYPNNCISFKLLGWFPHGNSPIPRTQRGKVWS